jgi:hypothetical protein
VCAVHVFLPVSRVVPKKMHIQEVDTKVRKRIRLCVCISWGRVLRCWSGSVCVTEEPVSSVNTTIHCPILSPHHRLNMELDLQSLFGLLRTYWLSLRPSNSPLPSHLGSYTRALLVSQDRRHLFATPWSTLSSPPPKNDDLSVTPLRFSVYSFVCSPPATLSSVQLC